MRYIILLFAFFFLISCEKREINRYSNSLQLKRVENIIEKNRNTLFNNYYEKKNLRKELNCLRNKIDSTSLYCLYLLSKSAIYNYNDDADDYLMQYELICRRTNDSLNYGRYLRLKGLLHYRNSEMDLAIEKYLKAEKLFRKIDKGDEIIEVNLSIALLLMYINDFTGAEMYLTKINSSSKNKIPNKFKIRILDKKTEILLQSSNHSFTIGQLEKETKNLLNNSVLKEHESNYLKAVLAKIYFLKNDNLKSYKLLNEVLNNKKFIYYYFQETYDLNLYNLINKEKIFKKKNFKKEYENLANEINKSNLPKDKLMVYMDYANYLFRIGDYKESIKYARKSTILGKEVKNNYSLLNSLLLQAKIDKVNAVNYFIKYDKIIDELINYQRFQKDNFYKIQLETNTIAQDKEKAEHQRNQVILAIGILMVFSAFLFIIYRNRLMNSKIEFQHKHQKSNEQIHELILKNQALEVEVRQKEQRRIAMEIHDGVLNQLASIRFKLFKLELNQEAQTIKEALYNVNTIQNIEVELRNLTHDLHAQSSNERIALLPIVQQLIQVHQEVYGIPIELYQDEWDWEQLSTEIKMGFTRIIQEALFNVVKHAKASKIEIHLHHLPNSILLSIKDNGKGMDLSVQSPGIGLENIHLRAEQIQAKVKITSEKNKGTQIQINTPV